MKRYFAILDTRSKSQREANELIKYFVEENGIAPHRIICIPHNRRFKLAWMIYDKDLHQKRGGFYVWGDVKEYRKHLIESTAIVEKWLKIRGNNA
jgi:hypothetical protein